MAKQQTQAPTRPPLSVAVDTGGTHTDLVLLEHNRMHTIKVPTTPENISLGIVAGVTQMMVRAKQSFPQLERFLYASTFATNLLVEGASLPIGLITTQGFRDVLEIGRASRKPDVYDIHWRPSTPLVPRHLRLEVSERIGPMGEVITALDEETVHQAFQSLIKEGIDSVAVCFLHAYSNPEHERRVREIAQAHYPQIEITLSSDVVREFREFERTSTACVSALVKKPMAEHLTGLSEALNQEGAQTNRYIMRANGGLSTFKNSIQQPAALTHSGVIGGIIGAASLGRHSGIHNIVTLDMGGTSTDISLITDGVLPLTNRSTAAGHPVLVPTLDMVTIGAGGGSLGWVDGGTAMRVGPRSSGSVPGPACYGQGGTQPTVTDAHLVCHRLSADYFLEGKRKLYPQLAQQAVEELGAQLGLSSIQAALGILSITEANMADAVRLVSVERGIDLRDYTLIAFGGAGGLHGARLAEALHITRVLIPPAPGNLSATGLLCADIRHDFARSRVCTLDIEAVEPVKSLLQALQSQALAALEQDGIQAEDGLLHYALDLRYQGQNYELNVDLAEQDLTDGFAQARARFHAQHERIYGYSLKDRTIQLVNVRVTALGPMAVDPWLKYPFSNMQPGQPAQWREVVLAADDIRSVPVYRFSDLIPGQAIDSPAIIEYSGSTTFMPPGWQAELDEYLCLHMTRPIAAFKP